MERMRLLSSIFRSKKTEEKCIETLKGFRGESCSDTSRRFQEAEEDACTSYSHR